MSPQLIVSATVCQDKASLSTTKNEYLISLTMSCARPVYTYHCIKILPAGCCLKPGVILWLKASMHFAANKADSLSKRKLCFVDPLPIICR